MGLHHRMVCGRSASSLDQAKKQMESAIVNELVNRNSGTRKRDESNARPTNGLQVRNPMGKTLILSGCAGALKSRCIDVLRGNGRQ